MKVKSTRQTVLQILRSVAGKKIADSVDPDLPLTSIQGIDSMALINLMVGIESSLGISFDDEIADENFVFTLNNILQKVEAECKKQ